MALGIGTSLGPYEVRSALGRGGMGEVYRARDRKLGRDVALKVLPAAFAANPERMARFEREAQILASLNHPNIAVIYGLEESAGIRALVMELIEGPTLADRIREGPIPTSEAIAIARQIAEALEEAHDRGVVHRDLKPANVKLTKSGLVKVLDFGLAKALEPESASAVSYDSPTASLPTTQTGVVLGTAGYMSPEQTRGKPVDKRTDIWAFGVVLAEMISGKQVFAGETVSEVIASVIRDEPVIPDTAPTIQALLKRCLDRNPKTRLRDIGEARVVLADPAAATLGLGGDALRAASKSRGGNWLGLVATAAVVAVAVVWIFKPTPATLEAPLRKFNVPVERLHFDINHSPFISPDGKKLVYASNRKLWIRDLAAVEPRQLATGDNPTNFAWSPDSNYVAYFADARLWKVAASGGEPTVVATAPRQLGTGAGIAWDANGRIVLSSAITGRGIEQVPSDGGDFTTLVPLAKDEADYHDVAVLPDEKGLLFAVDAGFGVSDVIAVSSGETKKTVVRFPGEVLRSPHYSPSGHVVFERTTNNPGVWAIPFALATLESSGEPFLIAPLGSSPSVSRDGTLAFVPDMPAVPRELAWVSRNGTVEQTLGPPQIGMTEPALSPDGARVAVAVGPERSHEIWIHDLTRKTQTRLTFVEKDSRYPAWVPPGNRIIFDAPAPQSASSSSLPVARSIASYPADGAGALTTIAPVGRIPGVSPDGRYVMYMAPGTDATATALDLWYAKLDGDPDARVFESSAASQVEARFSPDGHLVAYVSNESGRPEVYVKPFPSGEGKWQVSSGGGRAPLWTRTGDRLVYWEPATNKIIERDVTTKPAVSFGTPRDVFTAEADLTRGWDISADGRRFLVVRDVGGTSSTARNISVVQNWFAEYRR